MTDTTTMAKLSPRAAATPDAEEQVVPATGDSQPPANGRRSLPLGTIARNGMRVLAVAAVAFLVFALWLSGLAHARSQVGLQRRFRSELSNNSAPVGGAIPTGAPIAIVQIPSIGLTEAVVQGSRSGQLRAGPGHVVGTPLPGQPGNAVVAGRRTLYGGPFGHLGSLHAGDRIHMTTGEGNTTYRVTSVTDLGASDGSFVQEQGDNRLTLFTTDSPWTASGRLVVTAKLVGNPFPPTDTQHALDADGLGLTGERDGAPNMLVWLELLAGAALLAAYAASRWSRPRVWLVFAPLLAMTMWLFFESFVRLLPATL
jgi:sortase A